MIISKIISDVNQIKPNKYTQEQFIAWLSELDGMVYNEVLINQEDCDITFKPYDNDQQKLLIEEPYDTAYLYWLMSKIDFFDRDIDGYTNNRILFNNTYADYQAAAIRNHMPKQRNHIVI